MLWLQIALLADELVPCARRVAETGRYACLVQHRRGYARSDPWFAQVRDWVRAILPHADEHVILGAGHDLALTHADEMAAAVAAFLDAHPLEVGGAP